MTIAESKSVTVDGVKYELGMAVTSLDLIRTLSGLEFLQRIRDDELPQPSIHGTFDFRLIDVSQGRAVFSGCPNANFLNPMGTVHGSYIAALLDSAMACSAHTLCPAGTTNTSVEMKVNFVRPVLSSTGRLTATGEVINGGRTLAVTEGKLIGDDGKIYAYGSQTCMRIQLA